MAAADLVLDRLDALPRTVAHHDTQWNNLFQEEAKEGRGTVAIDWGFFGTAPIGEDLGHHIGLNVFLGAVQPHDADEHERTATKAYLNGLDAFGWRGNIDDVRFAAVAAGALQMLPIAVCHLADLCPEFGEVEPWPDDEAESQKSSVEAVMDTWCQAFRYLMTLGRTCLRICRSMNQEVSTGSRDGEALVASDGQIRDEPACFGLRLSGPEGLQGRKDGSADARLAACECDRTAECAGDQVRLRRLSSHTASATSTRTTSISGRPKPNMT